MGSVCITFLLSGCTHTQVVDHPRTIEVKIPVEKAIPAELLADCPVAALKGTTVNDSLDRLASLEGLRKCYEERMAKLRPKH